MQRRMIRGFDSSFPRNAGGFAVLLAVAAALAPGGGNTRAGFAASARLQLSTPAFHARAFIPRRYTCSGANTSPSLTWSRPPEGTQSFTLVLTDPDAPAHPWVHWVVFNLPPRTMTLPEGVPKGHHIQGGGSQGVNDFRFAGYGGPCPPPGEPHRYFFRLYALNIRLSLKPDATKADVERAMKGHVLAEAELMGRYRR